MYVQRIMTKEQLQQARDDHKEQRLFIKEIQVRLRQHKAADDEVFSLYEMIEQAVRR